MQQSQVQCRHCHRRQSWAIKADSSRIEELRRLQESNEAPESYYKRIGQSRRCAKPRRRSGCSSSPAAKSPRGTIEVPGRHLDRIVRFRHRTSSLHGSESTPASEQNRAAMPIKSVLQDVQKSIGPDNRPACVMMGTGKHQPCRIKGKILLLIRNVYLIFSLNFDLSAKTAPMLP